MTRFFFDTHDGNFLNRDTEGTILPNRLAARREAQATLGHMAKDELPDGDMRSLYVNIRENDRLSIYTVSMSVVGRWLD